MRDSRRPSSRSAEPQRSQARTISTILVLPSNLHGSLKRQLGKHVKRSLADYPPSEPRFNFLTRFGASPALLSATEAGKLADPIRQLCSVTRFDEPPIIGVYHCRDRTDVRG